MTRPADAPAELAAELRRHYTPEQLVELVLDTLKWDTQKVPVALGVDVRLDADGPALLRFDADGAPIVERGADPIQAGGCQVAPSLPGRGSTLPPSSCTIASRAGSLVASVASWSSASAARGSSPPG